MSFVMVCIGLKHEKLRGGKEGDVYIKGLPYEERSPIMKNIAYIYAKYYKDILVFTMVSLIGTQSSEYPRSPRRFPR